MSLLSIRAIYELHKKECPDSMLSERAIRQAVKAGDLPSISAGNRSLINTETFSAWLRGERRD